MRQNRIEHKKSQAEWSISIARQQRSRPHRAARVAQRTRLANGLLENSADMPSISMGFIGKKKECRKPSIAAFVNSQAHDFDLDAPAASVDDVLCEQSSAPLGWTVSFARISSRKLRPLRRKNKLNSNLAMKGAPDEDLDGSCLETTAGETTASDHSDSNDDTIDAGPPPQCHDNPLDSEEGACKVCSTAVKRQLIVRDIIVTLREETLEAQQAAREAEKKRQEAQKRLILLEETQLAHQKQVEKQRSLSQRKKRNQASHNQSVRAKAEKVLLEANSMKEQAENEAAQIRALAVADVQARTESLQHEDVKLQQSWETVANLRAEIELQAQAILAQAETRAHEIKQQASVEAALKSEDLVECAKSRAQEEADAIKASALKHALALRAKVEEQVQNKLEAAKQAQANAEEAAAAAAATVEKLALDSQEAERQARLQTIAAIKEVKKTEQQRSKKHQHQMAQQRKHATHLHSLKEKAELALKEANAIRETVENEVSEIRTRTFIEAQATAADERQALLDAHIEVEELRNEAVSMKATLDAQARSALSELAVSAEEVKRQASAEAAAQAEAVIEAAKSRAEQEALSIKAAALEHALALRAKVEEQVKATLDAAKQSKCEADAAAAAAAKLAVDEKERAEKHACAQAASALKRAKEVDMQRAKKYQRQAIQERRIQELKQRALDEARYQASEESRQIKEQAVQDAALLKAHARAEAQKLKSKTKAAVRAKVQDNTAKITAFATAEALRLKSQAEEEAEAIRTQIAKERDALAQERAELAQKNVPARLDSVSCVRKEIDACNNADEISEDWELLHDTSVEQCHDVPMDLVLV